MENYFESQRDQIFRSVEVLIYVFDIESNERKKDLEQFNSCINAIKQNSKNAHIFCLIHKMDLIHEEKDKAKIFEEREKELKKLAEPMKITCFGTSIWYEY
jgi:Ras-related GTP-binding protein A/B